MQSKKFKIVRTVPEHLRKDFYKYVQKIYAKRKADK